MQIRMREDEKRMMEDDVIPIPDLMMGEEDLRGKGGECGIKDGLSFPMHVYCLRRAACTYVCVDCVVCVCTQVVQCLAA